MITILAIFLLLLSLVSTIILKNFSLSVFLLLLVSNTTNESSVIIASLGATLLLQYFLIKKIEKNKVFWYILIAFVAYYAAIFFFRPYKIHFSSYASYINGFIIFLLTLSVNWNREKLTKFITAYMSIFLFWGLMEYLFTDSLRISGPVHFATLYAVILIIVWTIWITEVVLNHGYVAKTIIMSILILIAVLLSGTRMGLIGIVLGLFLVGISRILVTNYEKSIFTKIFSGIAFLVCLSILTVAIWKLIPDDMLIKKTFGYLISMKLDNSNLGRVIAWLAATETIPKHPLWGIGPYNFNIYLHNVALAYNIQNPTYHTLGHAHNLFLIVLSELGISGFFVIGSIVFLCEFKLIHNILKGTRNSIEYAIFNGFVVMMVLGMFDGTPLTVGTLGFGGWLMGISFHFSFLQKDKVC